jgi:RNA polymerase sigma-70 factor (ECF subfamily)
MPAFDAHRERDAEVVRRVLHGETEAYGELVNRYQDRLRSALSFYCFRAEEVEEHLQEAFVEGYAHLPGLDTTSPFFPWLKRIAVNGVLQEIRRRKVSARHAGDYLRHVQTSRLDRDPEAAVAEEQRAALKRCIEELPSTHTQLLTARYRDEASIGDLARRFRTTAGAMKVRLLRLRQALGECIRRRLSVAEGSLP